MLRVVISLLLFNIVIIYFVSYIAHLIRSITMGLTDYHPYQGIIEL